jgi:hypothetical protein
MNLRQVFSLSAFTALVLVLLPGSALSQQKSLKDQLVGQWTLVSFENTAADGTKRHLYGANPKGLFMFAANGKYAQVQVKPDRPKFEANNRLQGTPEENKVALAGTYATFGTWSVNETEGTLIRHIEGSASFPNEEGRDTKWSVTLTGDELKVSVPAPAAGGRTDLLLKRVN